MSRKIAVYKYRVERKIPDVMIPERLVYKCMWRLTNVLVHSSCWTVKFCNMHHWYLSSPEGASHSTCSLCPLICQMQRFVRLDTSAQRKTAQWGRWRSGRTRQSPLGCAASSSILSGRSEAQTRQFWVFTAPFWWLVCFVAEDDATQEVWTSLGFLLHPLGKHRSLVHITFTQRLVHSVVVGI